MELIHTLTSYSYIRFNKGYSSDHSQTVIGSDPVGIILNILLAVLLVIGVSSAATMLYKGRKEKMDEAREEEMWE